MFHLLQCSSTYLLGYDILEKKMNLCGFFLSQIVKFVYSILFCFEMVVFTAKEIKYAFNSLRFSFTFPRNQVNLIKSKHEQNVHTFK